MATRLQRKAFRKNAKRSTGPRTPEGKARSSQNACKHGLFARDAVLPEENPEEFLQLIADLEQELEACGDFECRLVHHIAGAEWRMRRLVRLETGALTSQLEKERLYAHRMQAELGKLNQSVQAKPGEQMSDSLSGCVHLLPGIGDSPLSVEPAPATQHQPKQHFAAPLHTPSDTHSSRPDRTGHFYLAANRTFLLGVDI